MMILSTIRAKAHFVRTPLSLLLATWLGAVGQVVAQPAVAQPAVATLDTVEQCMGEVDLYQRERQFEQALQIIDRCLENHPDDANLLLRRALILHSYDRLDQALVAYRSALSAGIDGRDERPVKKIIRDLRPVENQSGIRIEVTNGPAEVYVKHKSYGVRCLAAPICTIGRLPGKTYRLWVERAGFHPYKNTVRVKGRSLTDHKVTLEELPSALEIDVWPQHAQVKVGDKHLGAGRHAIDIPAGTTTVQVSAPGHVTVARTVSAQRGQPMDIRIELPEMLYVTATPATAELFLDGRSVTPLDGVIELPPGGQAHALSVRAPGFIDQEVPIPEERSAPHRMEVSLEVEPEPPAPPVPPEWDKSKIAAVSGLAAMAVAGFATSAVLTWSASGQVERGREDCEYAVTAGIWLCSRASYESIRAANARAGTAELVGAAGAVALVGALWALNMNERFLHEQPGGKRFSRTRKLTIGANVGIVLAGLTVGGLYARQAGQWRTQMASQCTDELCTSRNDTLAQQARLDARTAAAGFVVAGTAAVSTALLWRAATNGKRRVSGRQSRPGKDLAIVPTLNLNGVGVHITGRL